MNLRGYQILRRELQGEEAVNNALETNTAASNRFFLTDVLWPAIDLAAPKGQRAATERRVARNRKEEKMIRNMKALGLALVAFAAMSAVIASTASAQVGQGFLTSDGPVTLVGTETGAKGSGSNALTSFGGKTECFGSTYTGHKLNETPHKLIPVPAKEVTITPHYNQKECRAFNPEELEATVEMDSCDFAFTLGATTPAGNLNSTYGVTAEVICPIGSKIHVGVWAKGAAHETGNRLCTIEVPSQGGLVGAHVTGTPKAIPEDIDITGTFEKIKVERHGLCLLDGKGTTDLNGKFDIDVTVKGQTADGTSTPITVTDS